MCETFDLRKYMTFSTEVVGCRFDEERGEWKVRLRETKEGQEPREFDDWCHLLLHATGILNNFKVSQKRPLLCRNGRNNTDLSPSGPTSRACRINSKAASSTPPNGRTPTNKPNGNPIA